MYREPRVRVYDVLRLYSEGRTGRSDSGVGPTHWTDPKMAHSRKIQVHETGP